MTTVVWVSLCVLGLLTGFAVGWSRRHRRPAPEPTPAPVTDEQADDAPVIDLRVIPAEPAPPEEPPDPPPSRPTEDDEPARATPRLSLATAGGSAVSDRAAEQDAKVIDLAAATRPVPLHNLQFIEGVGPRLDKRLRANGIVTVPDLAAMRRKELRRILSAHLPGGDDDVDHLRALARSMVESAARGRVAPADTGTELRRIQGIGTTMMRWLETQQITTLAQLAELTKADVDQLQEKLSDYPGRIRAEKWRGQARRILV